MKSAYRRHRNYPMDDQKMSPRGLGAWRRYLRRHTHWYRCYTDEGEMYRGTRTIFRVSLK